MKYLKFLAFPIVIFFNGGCSEAKTKQKETIIEETENAEVNEVKFLQHKISDDLYVLKAPTYHTNVGVFIGDEEVLVIDPMTGASNHQALLDEIKTISEKPVTYVLNTHSHGDHSGANSFFAALGAKLISHENAKFSRAMVDTTFKDSYTIDLGNETLALYHIAAHTFDDVLVHFTTTNAVFMGDTFMTNSFPHFYYGGGSKGHISILEKAIALSNDRTTIVAAHGKLATTKKELETYKENSTQWIGKIKELSNKGATSTEITEDSEIKVMALQFTGSDKVPVQTIEKTLSVEFIPAISVSENVLRSYEGRYAYGTGQINELVFQDGVLFFRSEGAYLFELAPISKTKFHVKGQAAQQHVTFAESGNAFTYFNGKENLEANRN